MPLIFWIEKDKISRAFPVTGKGKHTLYHFIFACEFAAGGTAAAAATIICQD